MRKRKVHLRLLGKYKCGVGKRWASQDISSTKTLKKVTCRSCRK